MQLNLDKNRVSDLKLLVGESQFEFLGYFVDLRSGEVFDSLKNTEPANSALSILETLLDHYSRAKQVEKEGKMMKFASLPGGQAYERAFVLRAVQPIAHEFGSNPEKLLECARRFGGVTRAYGDCAVELPSLPCIPLVVILWRESEFPAQASILFDKSASCYLPTEDLAVLGELTAFRLVETAKLPK